MNEFEASIMIDGGQVASRLKEFEGDLKAMIKEAWRLVFRHAIFAHDENLKQRAGLAGVLLALKERGDDEDYARVTKELDFWKAMSAAESGVPVDFGQLLGGFDSHEAIGISGLWDEFKKERDAQQAGV